MASSVVRDFRNRLCLYLMWNLQPADLRTALVAIAFPALLASSFAAQTARDSKPAVPPPLKIRVAFPEGISTDDVWLAYGLYTPGRIGRFIGLEGPAARVKRFAVSPVSGQGHVVTPRDSPAFYEIDALLGGERVERFQALVWAPGCKMMYFDVPAIIGDVEEHFVCSASREVALAGRVRGSHLEEKAATVWVSYYAGLSGCFLLHTCDKGCPINCFGTTILDIASATIGTDGSFKVELPDFSNDALVSRGGDVGFLFSVGENRESHICLEPESPEARFLLGGLKIAPSYPGDLIFLTDQKCKW